MSEEPAGPQPLDAVPVDSPPEVARPEGTSAADVPMAARVATFCTRCGARLAPGETDCLLCAARNIPVAKIAAAGSNPLESDVAPVKSAMGLYFSLLGISLTLTIYLLAARHPEGQTAEFVATSGFTIAIIIWAVRFRQALAPLLLRVGPLWPYLVAPVLATCTFVIASLVVAGLRVFLHVPSLNYLDDLVEAGYGFGFAVVLICVQPAIFEELAFRGVMTSALDRVLTPRETSIVVAFLFGILHLSVPSLAHLTLLGLLLAWLRRKAGSLYPCMLMHFTHNLLVLLNERYGWTPW